jgi:Arm DNA-binding domain
MSRQQLPPQIRKVDVLDHKSGKTVVRYELRVDGGVNPVSGQRQQTKRRFNTEKAARAALGEITDQATTGTFVARSVLTVDQLCTDGRPLQPAPDVRLEAGLRPGTAAGALRVDAGAATHQGSP